MPRVFISYKRANKDKVFPLKDKIEAAIGEPCWIDMEGVESDAQFANVEVRALADAEIFLFMYSKEHSRIMDYTRDWSIREIDFAQAEGKRIVFVNIDKTPLTKWFQFMFGPKQQVDATSETEFANFLADLQEWLHVDPHKILVNKEKITEKNTVSIVSSYKIQEEYQEAHSSNITHKGNEPISGGGIANVKAPKYDVFISYSRRDYIDENRNVIPNNVVSQIKDLLSKEGISYWFDEDGIYSGQNFTEKIVSNIKASAIFLFISTANANESKWTCKEIAVADEFGKHIIPVRIDKTPYNDKVLFRIADLDYIEYYANPQRGMSDIVQSIKAYCQEFVKTQENSNQLNNHTEGYVKSIESERSDDSFSREKPNTLATNFTEGLEYIYNKELLTAHVKGIGNAEATHLVIPSTVHYKGLDYKVESIEPYAFYDNLYITSVIIPSGITEIGDRTFKGCNSLNSVRIPDTVLYIGRDAFSGCKNLTSVILPPNLSSIEDSTFCSCGSLTSIVIPNKVKSIGKYAFAYTKVSSVVIPESVTQINSYAFAYCKDLKSVSFPKHIKEIASWAFSDCDNLNQVSLCRDTNLEYTTFPRHCQISYN